MLRVLLLVTWVARRISHFVFRLHCWIVGLWRNPYLVWCLPSVPLEWQKVVWKISIHSVLSLFVFDVKAHLDSLQFNLACAFIFVRALHRVARCRLMDLNSYLVLHVGPGNKMSLEGIWNTCHLERQDGACWFFFGPRSPFPARISKVAQKPLSHTAAEAAPVLAATSQFLVF